MDCKASRLYLTFADVLEARVEIDFEPEDDDLDALVEPEVAYGMGVSAVDFFMGALSRLGDSSIHLAALFTKAFIRGLVANQIVITPEVEDDTESDEPPS